MDLALSVAFDDGGEPCVGIDAVHLADLDERGDHSPVFGTGVMTCEEGLLAVQGDRADRALDGIAIGHAVIGVPSAARGSDQVMVESLCRDRGVGVRRSGQAELTLSCELALLSGRPCDYPVCAVSAYP